MVNKPEAHGMRLEKAAHSINDYRMTEKQRHHASHGKKMGDKQIKNLVIIAENVEQNALATCGNQLRPSRS